MNDHDEDRRGSAERPPLFGTWRSWYAVVLTELVLIMAAAYLLTEAYR